MLDNRLVAVDDRIEARTAEGALKEQLANIITAAVEPAFLGIFRLFLTEASKFPEIFAAFYATTEQQSKRLLLKQLARHDEFARSKVPHEETASMLLNMAGILVMMASAQPELHEEISPEREAARIVDVILHGVLEGGANAP